MHTPFKVTSSLLDPIPCDKSVAVSFDGEHAAKLYALVSYLPRYLTIAVQSGAIILSPTGREKAMKRTSRRLSLGIAVLLLALPTWPQQPSAPPPPERVIINFILPIDSNTVNLLLGIVNGQVARGVKKITIVISSPGGDTTAAFAAYNILKNVQAEITTFNGGNIDSAAMLIYCAGKYRYSFPDPARFLIHGNAMTLGTGVPMDYNFLDAQLQQIKSLNQMVVQVLAANSNRKQSDLENAVRGQTILSPELAKQWGIVQEIRDTFMEPGAAFVSVNPPAPEQKKPFEYSTIRPGISSGPLKQ
jgi:ATP-dependent Clp protease, protease subunit